jgi:hypothetical protein
MPAIIFRGAHIRYVDLRYDEDSRMVYHRIHASADWTQEAREFCGFEHGEDIPESVSTGKIDFDTTASHMVLTPNQKELRQHELQLAVTGLEGFGLFRSGKDDKHKEELRFIMTTSERGAAGALENFIQPCGLADCALKVTFAQQQRLQEQPAAAPEEEQTVLADEEGVPVLRGEAAKGHKRVMEKIMGGKVTGGVTQ